MEIISLQKYVRVTPKKMRFIADAVRMMAPTEAVEKLPFLPKRGSEVLLKVIKSALDNAKQKGISDSDLIFKEIQISEGPRLRRGRAASRGRWHPFKRRMSHIRVVLTNKNINEKQKVEKSGVAAKSEEGKTSIKNSRAINKQGKKASNTKFKNKIAKVLRKRKEN